MCFPLDYSIMNGDLTRKEFSLGCSCTMKVQEVQETNMAVIEITSKRWYRLSKTLSAAIYKQQSSDIQVEVFHQLTKFCQVCV